ncbi:MAG: ATP synthase F1 subunit gamma [Deltaproteobacteria bacterium]|nr:ATP synthase F1 subunit gamma [Deltaproteobacteria bacterium]
MPSLKDIRRRIQSVRNTRQITTAMKLVAGAKLRKATENAQSARPYQEALTRVLSRLAGTSGEGEQPLLQARPERAEVEFVAFTSDRGLCGGFNSILLRDLEHRIAAARVEGCRVRVRVFGKKGRDYLVKRRYELTESRIHVTTAEYPEEARTLGATLRADFAEGGVDEVILCFNRFHSVGVQKPVALPILPLKLEAGEDAEPAEYRYEPDADRILAALIPLYVDTVILQALLETDAGEYAAKMKAMDAATRNATELIDSLTLAYNRARQAAITKELIEIVSAAEAL